MGLRRLWRYAWVPWLWLLMSCGDRSLLGRLYRDGLKLASIADLPTAPLRAEVLGEWVCGGESMIVERRGEEYALTVLSTSLDDPDTVLPAREVRVGTWPLVAVGVPQRRDGVVWLLASLRRAGADLVVQGIRAVGEDPQAQLRWLAAHPHATVATDGTPLVTEYVFFPAPEPVRTAQARDFELQIDTLDAYAVYAARFPDHPDLPGVLERAARRIATTSADIAELGAVAARVPAVAAEAEAHAVTLAVDLNTIAAFASAFPRSTQRDALLGWALDHADTDDELTMLIDRFPDDPVAIGARRRLQDRALAHALTDDDLAALLVRWPDDAAWARRVQTARVLRGFSSDRIRFHGYGITLTPSGAEELEQVVAFVQMANRPDPILPDLYVTVRAVEPGLPDDAAFLLSCDRASTLGARLRAALPGVAVHLIPVGGDPAGPAVAFATLRDATAADRERYSRAVIEDGRGTTLPDAEGEHAGGTWVSGQRMAVVVLGRLEDELSAVGSGRPVAPVVPPELWYGFDPCAAADEGSCADAIPTDAFRREAKDLARDLGVRRKDVERLVEGPPPR